MLLFLAFLVYLIHFKRRLVNFYDTDKPKKLNNSYSPNCSSWSFWLCSHFTECVAVSWTWSINDISKHGDIKEKRNGADKIKPEEKAEKVIVKNKTAENHLNRKNDNQNDIENIETNIIRLLSSNYPDIVTNQRVYCKQSDKDLQWNTKNKWYEYLIRTFFMDWAKFLGRLSRVINSRLPLVKKLSPLPGFWNINNWYFQALSCVGHYFFYVEYLSLSML